ncbi:hypothetical protein ABTZ03_10300 [Kitasatospora sp. NPDC096077]|uniref:hypothetical protein n=1 Tax=unclassified Kitasatospora TaxID=2633591 RepID=UPI003319F963
MTRLAFPTFTHARTPHQGRTPVRGARLLRGFLRSTPHLPPLTLPADAPIVRGLLKLTLEDGTPRLYLLDHRDFSATTSPDVAYDSRVQTAYLLALQGHGPDRVAEHLGLPAAVTEVIAQHAARCGASGPGNTAPIA